MSTKIYTGFRIRYDDVDRDVDDLHVLTKFVEQAREQIMQQAQSIFLKQFTEQAVTLYDNRSVGFSDDLQDQAPAVGLWTHLVVNDRKQDNLASSMLNTNDGETSVTLHPIVDSNGVHKLLGMVFTQNNQLCQAWFKQQHHGCHVKDYHYQNQTDMPDNVDLHEWEQRKCDWEQAVLGQHDAVPSLNGFTVELVNKQYLFMCLTEALQNNEQLTPYIQSFEQRLEDVTDNVLFDRFMQQHPEYNNTSNIFSAVLEFNKSKTQQTVEQVKQELEPMIKKQLTIQDLFEQPTTEQ